MHIPDNGTRPRNDYDDNDYNYHDYHNHDH
jgi:hypothetical protein